MQVVKIFLKILSFVPKYQNWSNTQMQTQKQYIQDLVVSHGMVDLLLEDLACYKRKALTLWQPGVSKAASSVFCPETVDTYELFEEGYTHSKNVETRLSAIIYMLEACGN